VATCMLCFIRGVLTLPPFRIDLSDVEPFPAPVRGGAERLD
jgi:hypothetical protein